MFNINKFHAHIRMLELKLVRLEAYRQNIIVNLPLEESKITFVDRDRLKEVDVQITRAKNQIAAYQEKIDTHTPNSPTEDSAL